MTARELINSTPQERQLWYWRKEMESANRRRHMFPKGSDEYKSYDKAYRSAIASYNQLAGTHLEAQD